MIERAVRVLTEPFSGCLLGGRLNLQWSFFLHLFVYQVFIDHSVGASGERAVTKRDKSPCFCGVYILEGKYIKEGKQHILG